MESTLGGRVLKYSVSVRGGDRAYKIPRNEFPTDQGRCREEVEPGNIFKKTKN